MASSESFMFNIESSATLHLFFVACGPTIFDATTGIHTGIKVIAKVARSELIDLLVAVATLTSLGMWWVVVLA